MLFLQEGSIADLDTGLKLLESWGLLLADAPLHDKTQSSTVQSEWIRAEWITAAPTALGLCSLLT